MRPCEAVSSVPVAVQAPRGPPVWSRVLLQILAFKLNVRKLKNLGLTLSLESGYRLSSRGGAWLGRDVP